MQSLRALTLVATAVAAYGQTVPKLTRHPSPPDLSTGVFTADQVANMARLRDCAMSDDYAIHELRHLTDNIGPRLSGSPQAAKAVEYVAAEMKALGADVQLEPTTVPHWVRGIETGELVKWPGQASGTTQK